MTMLDGYVQRYTHTHTHTHAHTRTHTRTHTPPLAASYLHIITTLLTATAPTFLNLLQLLLLHLFNGLYSRTTGVSQYENGKTSLDLNETRDDWVLGMAVASTGPYANNVHLAPDR